jgi:hypothetical protein
LIAALALASGALAPSCRAAATRTGAQAGVPTPGADAVSVFTAGPVPSSAAGSAVPTVVVPERPSTDSGWTPLRTGVEERTWPDPRGQGLDLYALRLDPEVFQMGVGYAPGLPARLEEWAEATSADIVLNAGYFDSDMNATALVVASGTPHGTSYTGFGGMLAATGSAIDLEWLARTPFQSAEGVDQAIQAAPMLLYDGEVVYDERSSDTSRRTVVALDRAGNVVLIVAPSGGYSLASLARRLADPDLELDLERALNLDGGSSTGLWLAEPRREIPALVPLPAVVTFTEHP